MINFEKDLVVSFNQKQEAEADLFGIDILLNPTGYGINSSIKLQERQLLMKEMLMLLEIFLDLILILNLELFVKSFRK